MPNILFCFIMKRPGLMTRSLYVPQNPIAIVPEHGYLGVYMGHNGDMGDVEMDVVLQTL